MNHDHHQLIRDLEAAAEVAHPAHAPKLTEAVRLIERQDDLLRSIASVVGPVSIAKCPCMYCAIANLLRNAGVVLPILPESGPTLFDSLGES